jgi:photosystem II stability/assembly factor-like uncharacterized protein
MKLFAFVTALALFATPVAAAPYTWATVPFGGGGYVDGFLYHPTQKGLLYARTDVGGLYRYNRDGKSWVPLVDGFGHDDAQCFGTLSMAVDARDANTLYATCGLYTSPNAGGAAVIRSHDQGHTWQKTSLPFHLGANMLGRGDGERLQVDPADSRRLLLGTTQDGLWQSQDGGQSFSRVAGYPAASVSFVLFAGPVVYAGSAEKGGGLYWSLDNGNTFTAVPGSPRMVPHQAVQGADGTLYVTFADGPGPHDVHDGAVFKLTPAGAWTDISPVRPSGAKPFGYSGIDLDRQHAGTLVVSTSDRYGSDDIYLSHDGGVSWKSVDAVSKHHTETHPWLVAYTGNAERGTTARQNMGHWMDAVKINPFDSNELLYGTGYGVWMTHDLGAVNTGGKVDFDFADENLEETVILGLESPPSGPRLMAAVGDVAGGAWDDVTTGPSRLFAPEYETNQSVAYAALKPQIMARTADQAATSGYTSDDGGKTWTTMPSTPRVTKDAAGKFHESGMIAVSAEGTTLLWAPSGEPAYISKDMGKTWVASAGWPAIPDRGMTPIADPQSDSVFYAYNRTRNVVLKSGDGGKSFAVMTTGLPASEGWGGNQLRAVPGRTGDLWLAAPTGLLRLDGTTIRPVADVTTAWQVTFGKAAPGHDYPAVYLWGKVKGAEGLWRSDDAGQTWIRINDDAHQFGVMRAIAGDPREYGVLYIAPDGRGVMVGKPSA